MDLYNILLFLHIVGVLGLFVALGLEWTCLFRARRATTIEQAHDWLSVSDRLGPLHGISSLLILVPGLIMVFTTWGWGLGWVEVALAFTVLFMILGPTVVARRGAAISRTLAAAGTGPLTPDLRRQIHDPFLWTAMLTMSGAALGIVFLMTVKPGFVGAIIAILVAAALGFLVATRGWSRAGEIAPEMPAA